MSWLCELLPLAVVGLATLYQTSEALSVCHLEDLKYEYTECDSLGGRWRVQVPKEPGRCVMSSPSAPERGKDCNFACSTGEFLDVQGDQECHSCPKGTYSLGGGIRFDDWETLPSGFKVTTENIHQSRYGTRDTHSKHRNCSRAEWTARGNYVMSVPGYCPSNLIFSAKLIKAGKVTFEYQYTDEDAIFHFTVQNEQCQSMAYESGQDKWPKVTRGGHWATVVVELKSGMNVLVWRSIGGLSDMVQSTGSPIMIRKVEITGVAYTSECTKCINGTYSSGGSSFCQNCPANTYSTHGAQQCLACPQGTFSEPGATGCNEKPPCEKFDYYMMQKPCSEGKTQVLFQWKKPKICNENAPGSAALPVDGPEEDCPPCNPGMHLSSNTSQCVFCEENQWAKAGEQQCNDCPASTSPKYEVHYKHFAGMPPDLTSRCISIGVDPCSDTAGWVSAGDHVHTVFAPMDNYVFLVLMLTVDGFKGEPGTVDGKPILLSTITFELELECAEPCQLLFLSENPLNSDAGGKNDIIQTWDSTLEKTTISHEIYTNESVTFTWAFQPDDLSNIDPMSEARERMKNKAKIYDIHVTNTQKGGATECETCAMGKSEGGCIPCPDGHYVDSHTSQCKACPTGTVLPSSNAWGRESCKPCGEGLHPVGGRSCKSDCHYVDARGRDYDFTELDSLRFVTGARLFTASGTQYYHGFNISLCNLGHTGLPTCSNNVSVDTMPMGQPTSLTGMVCRSTLVPQSGDPEQAPVSTQPVSLGSHLTKIVSNVSMETQYEEQGFPTEGVERDIHFYYESGSPTSACPKGRISVISLRCDPDEMGQGRVELPPKCSDGTCDGCTFHFLWLTRHACAKCRRDDYKVVRGECVEGEQAIHYFPPDHCLELPEAELTPMSQKCSVLPFAVMIAIPVSLGVGIILLLALIYCWSRNKKLEYKYMKLVEGSGGNGEMELPAADTCGMSDEDEDEVHFQDASNRQGFFGKMKNKFGSSKKDDENPFVAVKMSESMSLTS